MHYIEHGSGFPVVALHGMGVDHREIAGVLEPVFAQRDGYRRLYPDLPGMGRTPAPESVASADDVLELLLGFVDDVVGDNEPLVVVGHSFGGYFARAIANRRPGQVVGLAVLCSTGGGVDVPEPVVLHSSVELDGVLDPAMDAEYRGYFVVRTPETLRSFREFVEPGIASVDEAALERVYGQLSGPPEDGPAFPHPTLILAGRQDSVVGYASAWALLAHYPRATFAVLDRAGHALHHEQPELLARLVSEWLDRVHEAQSGEPTRAPAQPT